MIMKLEHLGYMHIYTLLHWSRIPYKASEILSNGLRGPLKKQFITTLKKVDKSAAKEPKLPAT